MKNRLIYFVTTLLLTIASCNTSDSIDQQELSSMEQASTFDDLEAFTNSRGDTIQTGVPIPVTGKLIHPDSIKVPVARALLRQPKVVRTNTNVHPLGVPKVVKINQDELNVVKYNTPAVGEIQKNKDDHFILTNTGDTVRTGVPIPVTGKKVNIKEPRSTLALSPKIKDNAINNIHYLDVDEGLASSYVYTTCQDSRGDLWFATEYGGAVKYDGSSFTKYSRENGLIDNSVISMIEDKKGNFWFGTGKGVSKYDGETFTNFNENDGLGNNLVWSILEDKSGNIWFGTEGGGVTKYDGSTFTNYTINEGLSHNTVLSIIEDRNGNIWFGTYGGGAIKFDGHRFTHYREKDGLSSDIIYSMMEDHNGNIWFGTEGGGASKYNGSSFVHYTEKEGLGGNFLFSVMEDSNGTIWFGLDGEGVTSYDGKNFTRFTQNEGLSNGTVRSVFEDDSGNLWIGTSGGGVSCFRNGSFNHFTGNEGFCNYPANAIIEDKSGNFWFGTYGGGVVQYDGESFTHYTHKEGLSGDNVNCVLEDSRGNLWFGTQEAGVTKFDGTSFTYFTKAEGLSYHRVSCIIEDRDGNIWFGTPGGGVTKYDGTNFTHFTEEEGLIWNYIYQIFEDKDGDIWFATGKGITKYDGTNFTHFAEKKEGLINTSFTSVLEDREGMLWFGAFYNGIAQFSGNEFSHYTEIEGLSNNTVHNIIQDNNNRIWAGTENGLSMISEIPNQKGKSARGKDKEYGITTFGKRDGLIGVDFYTNSAFLDSENRMWWGTGKSLTVLELDNFQVATEPPTINLNRIEINETFYDYRAMLDSADQDFEYSGVPAFGNCPLNLVVPYDNNHLTFYYGATDWHAPHKIRYSYKIGAADAKWSEPTTEIKADFRNLSYGSYTFYVRAIGQSGEWSESIEYSFIVLPPWWHTWWARTLFVLFVILFLWLLIKMQTKRLKKRQLELENEIDVATKEIRVQKEKAEESEAFKQQFLANMSHEIRTPMNAVMGMTNLVLDTELKDKQKFYLERIKKSSDNLLHIINDILDLSKIEAGKMELEEIDFSIADTVDQVKQTLSHKAEEKGLDLVVTVKGNVNDVVLGDPVRLNQVLINLAGNAIKFTEKGSVNIAVSSSEKGVQFSIIDTGIGIPEDKLQTVFENFSQANASDTRKYGGTGLGLSISRQLVELMDSYIAIESKEGSGTTFSFIVDFKDGSAERLEERLALERSVDGTILNGLRILITDDNEYNRIVARDTLKSKANVEIHEAENGQVAVDMVTKMDYDAVLMDVQMPVMNGYMATQNIRAMEGAKGDTPIIALTASVLRVDLDKCTDAGMNSYIPKPFKAQELITGIATVLGIKLRTLDVEKTASKQEVNQDKVSEITDMTYLSNFCDGDQEKMNKYILMFTKSAPALLEKLNKGIEEKDFETIANQVHGFKTKFIMMGMSTTKDLGIELERLCRDEPSHPFILDKFQQLIANVELAVLELS
jgi:two-component system sensor histidine kinase ChiS